ncbi:MAG: hypothetical protein ACI3Y8_09460, partial [Candidatus Cryptobacteroides sp.]
MRGRLRMCAAAVLGLMEFCPAAELPSGDDARFNEAVLILTGESEIENVDEYEMDRYLKMMSSPLRLNSAGRPALLSSGLLTLYQAVSLIDYRDRNGPVMSFSE